MARELLRIAGKTSVVFATDWPHTRFEGLDIRPFIERVIEWCGRDEKLIDRLFRGNAEQLWGVKR
jgi:predicted TIM-barrel fold metal-dependent hydrolase